MGIRPLHGRWWVACALVGACCGCSLIVDTGNLVVRCEIPDSGTDPCAAVGLTCTDGTCQACKPVAELCDKLDNDCDGKVDEGFEAVPELCNGVDDNCNGVTDEGFDPDKDGFTWCGGGDPKLVDCAPNDPSIHPPKANPDGSTASPPELCDGKDNDCDGKIDEDPTCAPLRSCTATSCNMMGLTCDPVRNQCVAPQSSGSTCMSDAQCGNGFCVGMSAIGLGTSTRNNLCGSACCKDQDCSEGSVCVQSGTGARVCLPAEVAGRKRAMTGASCQQSADCASGVCQRGTCIATCSRDADCSGQACRLNSGSSLLMGAGAWICGSPAGRGVPGDLCTSFDPTSCQSALCSGLQCTAPCGSDADCGEGLACRYLSVQGLLGAGRVTACVTPDPQQPSPPGAACCTSADCGQGNICKPVQTGRDWGMYCQTGSAVQ